MSTRQKSFFEQDHKAKPRPHWKRTNSANDAVRNDSSHAGISKMTPISPSSQTKSKLKAFQFVEPVQDPITISSTPTHSNDENSAKPLDLLPDHNKNVQGAHEFEVTKEIPKTPATRIPLSDLFGNGDKVAKWAGLQDATPEERVYWKHTGSQHSPDDSESLPTPGTSINRAKKRARSSSPTGSPSLEKLTKESARKASFDLQQLQATLKTPQADPGIDLWNRYSNNMGVNRTPGSRPDAIIANLINVCSPRSPTGQSTTRSGGIARSMSGNIEWPMSKAKRRRLNDSFQDPQVGNTPELPRGDSHDQRDAKSSRMNVLLEKIQQSLVAPVGNSGMLGPTSSSPLPDRSDLDIEATSSPVNRPTKTMRRKQTLVIEGVGEQPPHELIDENDNSSQYGALDDDDVEMLEATEIALSTHQSALSKLPEEPTVGLTNLNVQEVRGLLLDMSQEVVALNRNQPMDDEYFDDDDEEMFAADLENVMALYDSQTQNIEGATKIEGVENGSETYGTASSKEPQMHEGTAAPIQQETILISDDEFGDLDDNDFEDFAAAQVAASQSLEGISGTQARRSPKHRAIQRYLVTQVEFGQYETDKGKSAPEKVLSVQEEKTNIKKIIILRQSWLMTPCGPGAYVHVIGMFSITGQCVIDDIQNMIILHPDHLISSTVVADSFSCIRRAVLQDRIKATSEPNKPQVYGHILHEIFQEAIKANRWDTEWLESTIERVVLEYIEDIYQIELTIPQAVEELRSKMPELQAWANIYITAKPQAEAIVKDRNGTQAIMSINKLLDVEEHVWSPMYGLKGNIDATVQVVMHDASGEKTLTVPFEVKTGRNSTNASHRAQTALYTLLLSDRYDIEIVYGVLYYLETSEISRIPAIRHELRHMIMQRNELACYVKDRLQLPPMLKNQHLCNRCYAKTACFTYHKLIDGGDGDSSGLGGKFDEVIRHLNPAHAEFFRLWDDLLTKEEKEMLKFRRELWTMVSEDREKVGRCFGKIIIEPGSSREDLEAPKINRFHYTFVKQQPPPDFSFLESQITIGEPIVISDEKGHFALANGYVTNVRKTRISVAVDRRLHNARIKRSGFDAEVNQVFAGIMEVREDGLASSTLTPEESMEEVSYRLDKDEFSNGMATARNNLVQIMADGPFRSRELRNLIVEGKVPSFKPASTAYNLSGQAGLNVDQLEAVEKVMTAQDYALVLGMPGTGKTTTIAHIIRALVAQGKSVLLTSYTHTAVDNILLKIRPDNIGVLRLGAVAKVHPLVREFAALASVPRKSIEELEEAYNSPQVVATTCLGINHPIFNKRTFDYCIVDEASQITLPVCLGPIRMAKKFILVGDHYQLPPLVQNEEAREGGLDVSLFKLLSDQHPSSVVRLRHQYRMAKDIMLLSNTLIYDGLLKCGTEEVAKSTLSIPNMNGLKQFHHTTQTLQPGQKNFCMGHQAPKCWIKDLLDPTRKACFINTDTLLPTSREEVHGPRIVNPTEASVCAQLVESFIATGLPPAEIGVITLYRSQLALLKHTLRHRGDVEMHTADKFQGRDKEVIILSLVRSNDTRNVGELLKDWRRVNVSLTRARTKLLVLGSRDTMTGNELLGKFLQLMDGKGWSYDLPPEALDLHYFEDMATQVTGSTTTQTAAASSMRSQPRGRTGGVGKQRSPAKGRMGERVLLGKRPVLRDIINDLS